MSPKRPDGAIDFSDLAPGVGEVIRAGQRRQAARSMNKTQRSRAERHTASYDLPEELTEHISTIAQELSVPTSHVARWLIERGLEHTSLEELKAARISSRSPRYIFLLFAPKASDQGKR